MNAFVQHFGFEFRTGLRNSTAAFMNYLFPLGFYLMMGFIMPEINPPFRDALIPAMVTFALHAATLLGLPDPLVNAREMGVFRSYKINGIPSTSILFIPALTTVLHLTIVAILITITAPALFAAPAPVTWPAYVLTFGAVAFACAGLGLLIGVIAPDSRATVLLSQIIFLPSMLLGGMMIPYSSLPEAAGRVARLLPATHAMNAFNGLAMGREADFAPWGSIAVLVVGGILAFALAVYLFNWDRRNATRRGHPLMALLALLPYAASIFLPSLAVA